MEFDALSVDVYRTSDPANRMPELTLDELTELMQKHRPELLQFLAHRVDSLETAADLFQEAFIRLMNTRGKTSIDNPRAFLFRVASNLAIDHLRSRSLRRDHELASETLPADAAQNTPSVEQIVMSEQQFERLILALSELPPKCRAVFVLLRLRQCSYAEVERELGISQTMIFKYLTRAMSHCRQRLEDDV